MDKKRVALYARVSTREQDPTNQTLDLKRYAEQRGWVIIGQYVDHGVSGAKDSRPQLNALMEAARKRKLDTILVWRFDRFARSTAHLLRSLEEFKHLGVDFVSFQENIDTSSALGQAIFTIVSAVAQLERDIIRERVCCGLRRAKSAGKQLGRPRVSIDAEKVKILAPEGLSVRAMARELGVSKSTVARLLSQKGGVKPVPASVGVAA